MKVIDLVLELDSMRFAGRGWRCWGVVKIFARFSFDVLWLRSDVLLKHAA